MVKQRQLLLPYPCAGGSDAQAVVKHAATGYTNNIKFETAQAEGDQLTGPQQADRDSGKLMGMQRRLSDEPPKKTRILDPDRFSEVHDPLFFSAPRFSLPCRHARMLLIRQSASGYPAHFRPAPNVYERTRECRVSRSLARAGKRCGLSVLNTHAKQGEWFTGCRVPGNAKD